jgi:hypothetical protein
MSERIKSDAVLCAIPDRELLGIVQQVLEQAGAKTVDTHSREELVALLRSHTFSGVITVSSWSIHTGQFDDDIELGDTPLVMLIDTWEWHVFDALRLGHGHDYSHLPLDVEELPYRARTVGILPRGG